MIARSKTSDAVFLVFCSMVVAGSSFITPTAGRCGTAHFLGFRMLGGLVVTVLLSAIEAIQNQTAIFLVALVLNVLVFLLVGIVLKRKIPREWYLPALAAWLVVYLSSYFFLFPAPNCI
jgi:hypothetical protein